jgi:hypothetical protein
MKNEESAELSYYASGVSEYMAYLIFSSFSILASVLLRASRLSSRLDCRATNQQ